MTQQMLPLVIPEYEREYHAFEPQRYDGAMDTPLGCKRCGKVLWHPIHSRTEGTYTPNPLSREGGE